MEITGAGTAKPFGAGVNERGQLATACVTVTKEHEINHDDGEAYSVFVSVTPTLVSAPATGCFLYLKNDSDFDMIVSEMMMYAATTEVFSIKLGDSGTPIGGNAATPVNRNAGSGNEADVTALTSTEITGMAGGGVVFGFTKEGGTDSVRLAPATGFVIPKNKILTAYVATGAIAVRFGMGITFHEKGH